MNSWLTQTHTTKIQYIMIGYDGSVLEEMVKKERERERLLRRWNNKENSIYGWVYKWHWFKQLYTLYIPINIKTR